MLRSTRTNLSHRSQQGKDEESLPHNGGGMGRLGGDLRDGHERFYHAVQAVSGN